MEALYVSDFKESLDTRSLNKESLNKDSLNKGKLNKEMLRKSTLVPNWRGLPSSSVQQQQSLFKKKKKTIMAGSHLRQPIMDCLKEYVDDTYIYKACLEPSP